MFTSTSTQRTELITVISDTICPWCFVGKRRLDTALMVLRGEGLEFEVEWRPFQLNPDMPDEGADRRTYRAAKFGTAKSDFLDSQMVETGAHSGIAFRYDLIERTPNTLASHVMIADARRAGGLTTQDAVVEALFTAYFVEGRDVGRPEVLCDIALQVGFDFASSVSADLWEVVQQEDTEARRSGVSGVPTFLLDGHYLFSGAQPAEEIVKTLRFASGRAANVQYAALSGDRL